jgi:plasmid stabilization system protein ParE
LIVDVLFSPSARVQFLHAVETIRRNNRAAARKFHKEAGNALKRLARFPNSGAAVAELPELPYREVFIKPYRFFHRVREDVVWIVAVWHGAQIPDDPEG